MHYPVDVFIGKIRDYDGSRPSAIAKVQIDGELELTDLGLQGDEQAAVEGPGPVAERAAHDVDGLVTRDDERRSKARDHAQRDDGEVTHTAVHDKTSLGRVVRAFDNTLRLGFGFRH